MRGPRKFCQRDSNFDNVFLDERISGAIIGPPAKRHLTDDGLQIACRWRTDDSPTLNAGSFVIYQGIKTCIARKPFIFVIFEEGGPDPPAPPPPLDQHMASILTDDLDLSFLSAY